MAVQTSSLQQKGAKNLLALSRSKDIEIAMREWGFTGEILREGDEQFREHEVCELCHTPGLRSAYHITNEFTGNDLWVGNECIMRYTRLDGAEDERENRAYFQHSLKDLAVRQELDAILHELTTSRDHKIGFNKIDRLHRLVCRVCEVRRVGEIKQVRFHHHMSEITGKVWNEYANQAATRDQAKLVYQALFEPLKVGKLSAAAKNDKVEPTYVGGKRTQVATTMARGEHTQAADQGL